MKNFHIILILCLTTIANGFHDLPHMLILGIAKKRLMMSDPEIVDIAEHYFNQFEEEHLKGSVSFEEHSLWSDEIKDLYKDGVDYWGHWHYIDNVYNPFSVQVNPDCMDQHLNAVTAYTKIKDIFENQKLFGKMTIIKHIYLKHLVHLVGDIHQPLHTLSLFNEKYPKGDIGGNKQYVQVGKQKSNLHFYFDSGAFYYNFKDRIHRPLNETFKSYFDSEVEFLMKTYPITSFEIPEKDINIDTWIAESFSIAKEEIYTQVDLTNKVKVNVITDVNHEKNIEICKKQIAKAGYRLANVLSHFLSPEKGLFNINKSSNTFLSDESSKVNSLIAALVISGVAFVSIIACLSYRFNKLKYQYRSLKTY